MQFETCIWYDEEDACMSYEKAMGRRMHACAILRTYVGFTLGV
jgi:hypothetical protein